MSISTHSPEAAVRAATSAIAPAEPSFRPTELVAYCRGPFCAYAHEAVRRLYDAGRRARRLEEGWPEWRLATPPRTSAVAGGALDSDAV